MQRIYLFKEILHHMNELLIFLTCSHKNLIVVKNVI